MFKLPLLYDVTAWTCNFYPLEVVTNVESCEFMINLNDFHMFVFVQENMFQFDCEKEKYALKPMNCPGHW